MIKKILLLLTVVTAVWANAFAGSRENVEKAVAEMSGQCPIKLDEVAEISTIILSDTNVIMVLSMNIEPGMIDQMRGMEGMMKPDMLKGFQQDAETRSLLKDIKEMGGSFIISMVSSQGGEPLPLIFTNKEL